MSGRHCSALIAELNAYARFHFISEENMMARAGYPDLEAHRKHHNEVSATYASIASVINASPSEISLADNATRAWDMAFYGLDLHEGLVEVRRSEIVLADRGVRQGVDAPILRRVPVPPPEWQRDHTRLDGVGHAGRHRQ